MRLAEVNRNTSETQITLVLNLDGSGIAKIDTGVGFLDHMLTLFARHGIFDLTVKANGDLHIDSHHTVEDVGICLGQALSKAVGDKTGIRRYGHFTLPMDETLITVALDLSGRPFASWHVALPNEQLGIFNSTLAEEFWRGVTSNALMNYHVVCHHGNNAHHIIEAIFKASARALRAAVEIDPRVTGVPSTKGTLSA
jgi:imidazoleglycerol-phosphate dehydratase